MTDTSAPTPIAINPTWVTLLIPAVRWLLTVTGAATAANASGQAAQVAAGLVTVGTLAWSTISWYRAHQRTRSAIAAPATVPVVKLHL